MLVPIMGMCPLREALTGVILVIQACYSKDNMMRRSFIVFAATLAFTTLAHVSLAQKPTQPLPEKTRILFLLDGSGSMYARWENTVRINVAKKFLSDFVDSLRVNQNLELALRIYGHQFENRLRRCNDTKLEVPFSRSNHDAIIQKIRALEPKGNTPIAYSLEQTANDFPTDKDYRNIIIIITDGLESCDGDPCAVSLALQKKGIFLKPFIIGIGMEDNFEDAFGCMGKYYDARNISGFRMALADAVNQSLGETTVSVELLDADKKPIETNVNVSFINSFTKTSVFEFVHYRDRNGKPDSVSVDPVLSYDVVVNTIPPVVKRNVSFEGGKHNVLPIQSPQGSLKISFPGVVSYKDGVQCMVRNSTTGEIYTHFLANQSIKLLAGTYDIELLTLPRKTFKNVRINNHETYTINIEKPGLVNFISSSRGIGSLYELDSEGRQRWIHNLDANQTNHTLYIQPGRYKVVFRSEDAKGSKFTKITPFDIREGSSLTIRL